MRIWVQVFSSRERNPDFHGALEAREVLEIPVLGFLETTAHVAWCGSHAVLAARRGVKEIDGALVIDGLGILLKMAETAVKIQQFMGTFVSRKMLYQMPGKVVLERAKQDYGIDLL